MSSSASPLDAPPAMDGNRFAVVTDDDRTGVIWVVSILCFIYTLMVFGLRMEARRKNFGLDDGLAIAATVLASIQYILIFLANNRGLGKSYLVVSSTDAAVVGKYMLAGQVLMLVALGLAKCSVIYLCRRLFSSHRASHRVVCDVAMGLCALWSVASVLTITVDCDPLHLLGYNTDFCHSLVSRWIGIGVMDCVTEVAIVAMSLYGLYSLQMSIGRKFQAFATFFLRLILVVFSALHMTTLREATLTANTGVALTKPTVYLQIELLYALLSASIPTLNRWLRNFDTSMGSAWIYGSQAAYSNNSKTEERSRSRSVPMVQMDSSNTGSESKRTSLLKRDPSKRATVEIKTAEFVPTGPKYTATTTTLTESYARSNVSDGQAQSSTQSLESEDMIIRKDVEWQVQVQYEKGKSTPRPSS